jgi:hypothetical protein
LVLQVIGSGFGRTGTKSTKTALECLGFGPCHHMLEVAVHPEQVPLWQAHARGESVDWNAVFKGYAAQVDWPGAHVWRELAVAFPQAKVIHTRRPEEVWFKSFAATVGKLGQNYREMRLMPHVRDMLDICFDMVGAQTFGGSLTDRDIAMAALRRREDEVRAAIPADRLLVFDVAEGWGPLCAFLGVPVPDRPFPHHNLQADFWTLFGGEPG